jgi:hypothetical protein
MTPRSQADPSTSDAQLVRVTETRNKTGSRKLEKLDDNQQYDTDHDHNRWCDEKHNGVGGPAVAAMP